MATPLPPSPFLEVSFPLFFQCPPDAPKRMTNKWGWMDSSGECYHGKYWKTEAQARAAYLVMQNIGTSR